MPVNVEQAAAGSQWRTRNARLAVFDRIEYGAAFFRCEQRAPKLFATTLNGWYYTNERDKDGYDIMAPWESAADRPDEHSNGNP